MRKERFTLACMAALLMAIVLAACSPSEQPRSETNAEPAVEQPARSDLAALTAVAANVPATGASVQELIGIEDIRQILGREDIVFAVAT
jgi:ABC-type glycerol-3-phosphate transport system substrate-binding protein